MISYLIGDLLKMWKHILEIMQSTMEHIASMVLGDISKDWKDHNK
jgi:hypothetical protein